jgi:hypothetical protein
MSAGGVQVRGMAIVAALCLIVVLAGCGSSTTGGSSGGVASANGETSMASGGTSASGGTKASAGTTASASTPSKATTTAVAQPPVAKGTQAHYDLVANNVCNAIRAGAPRQLRPPTQRAVLVRYARAAESAAKRTVASLPHIPAPKSVQPGVRDLIIDYQTLAGLYRVASTSSAYPKHPAALANSVKLAEARAGLAAIRIGARACAPHPQDTSLVSAR